MSGPVLDFDPGAVRRPLSPDGDTREAPGIIDTISAGFRVSSDEQLFWQDSALDKAYIPVIEALRERDGDDRRDYATGLFSLDTLIPGRRGRVYDANKVWQAVEQYRKADPKAFAELGTREDFETQVLRRNGGRDADLDTLARGNGVAGFVGGMGGEFTDPVNIASLPIGGFGKGILGKMLTEGLVNAGVEVVQIPFRSAGRENLGETLTPGEAALNIVAAGFGGAAIRGGIELAPGAGRLANDQLIQPLRRMIDPDLPDKELAKAFTEMVPAHLRTPEQDAALFVIQRSEEIRAANPYVDTLDALDVHVGKMQTAMDAIEAGRVPGEVEIASAGPSAIAPTVRAPVAGVGRSFDLETVKAAIRGPESGGEKDPRTAVNRAGSSATGPYQMIRGTFIGTYQREYGVSEAAAKRAWATQRFDPQVQERLMDRFTLDNAAALQRAGVPVDNGNLYLAHFAGAGKAVELLRAPPDALTSDFFTATAIRQNKIYLANPDGTPRTVGEAINIIRGKVGDPGQRSPVPLAPDIDTPALRDPALDAERPVVMINGVAAPVTRFSASDISVDAGLMQFKSGGDEFGVIDTLRGVEEWSEMQAGMVTVWESLDGRRLIADGHQRHGLARRIAARTGQDIQLNALVLREADGFGAADARLFTAVQNISQGSGTRIDAAKIFRELADDPDTLADIMRQLPVSREGIKDAEGLSRLDDEAFGAVVNEVVPEAYGAAIGRLVPDSELHNGMVKILADTQPANRRQAEAIIRQALDAGFVKETQDSLFGPQDLMTGLFAQRAKLLDRALSELKRLKGAFGVAVRNAETLEAGGNRIDVAGSAAEVDANALALALVNALALRKGNAVNDLLTRAAERIAAGDKPADVLRQFIADVRQLDLDAIAREADGSGTGGDGVRGNAGDGEGAGADGDGFDGPGLFGDEPDLTPRAIDEAAASRPRSDHSDLPPDPDPRFAEPDGPGIVAAAESAWHDIGLTEEGGQMDFAAPTPAQVRAGLEQQGEGRLKGDAPQREPGADGGLFDTRDTTEMFDLGDGRGERSVGDIRAELDADKAAIETLRACLK